MIKWDQNINETWETIWKKNVYVTYLTGDLKNAILPIVIAYESYKVNINR